MTRMETPRETERPPAILGIAGLLGVLALCGLVDLVSDGVAVLCAIGAVVALIVWAAAAYIRKP